METNKTARNDYCCLETSLENEDGTRSELEIVMSIVLSAFAGFMTSSHLVSPAHLTPVMVTRGTLNGQNGFSVVLSLSTHTRTHRRAQTPDCPLCPGLISARSASVISRYLSALSVRMKSRLPTLRRQRGTESPAPHRQSEKHNNEREKRWRHAMLEPRGELTFLVLLSCLPTLRWTFSL